MTLQDLNGHLDMVVQLQDAKEALNNLEAKILGAQQFDGMPHSQEASRKTEQLAALLEAQREDVRRLERIVARSEVEVKTFIDTIGDNRTRLIFRLRFLCGCKWEDVADLIGGRNTRDAVRQVCYRYLQIEGDAPI